MKSLRTFFVFAALLIFGVLLGLYLGLQDDGKPATPEREEHPVAQDAIVDFTVTGGEPSPETLVPDFPQGAVEGEYIVHFESKDEYLAYIAALIAAGHKPLGQIDALMVVRIPKDALLSVDLGKYGARAGYSYRVQQPPPPVYIDPAALAGLRAYGTSARSIVKGVPHGDGSGIIVAVLDSGIERHPQFEDVDMVTMDLAGPGVSGAGAAHGTSVASIIAGREGIAPHAELFIVRVLDEEGVGNSYHVAEGIVQAVELGASVINLSLGVYQDSLLLRQAVSYASENGVLLVAAAGNDGYAQLPYPAAYEEVLAVTAVDAKGSQAVFPNQSEQIDFAAPGIGIRTAKEDEGTTLFSGTSAAAPFVGGTLASLMSGEEAMSADEAVEVLQRHLNDQGAPGTDSLYGDGVLDWDRLRERSTSDLLDVALADIHLDQNAQPGTNMPVEVTVQNRGTMWLNEAELEVLINEAEPLNFSIGTLRPGQITTRKVFTQVPSAGSEQSLEIVARVLPEDLNQDIRLDNNVKAVQYRPR